MDVLVRVALSVYVVHERVWVTTDEECDAGLWVVCCQHW